jgi:hypothetical protein
MILTFSLDQPRKKRTNGLSATQFYNHQNDQTSLEDSLWVLAYSFKGSVGIPGISEFLKAYINGGTVMNSNSLLRADYEDIHTGNFLKVNLASHRSATMPRDYIFATLPQFPWYRYPRKAIKMTFGEIYMDLYQQAAQHGHAFTCRFTVSMLDPDATDPVTSWLPSKHQPSPTCLGDFLKLVGHRVPEISRATANHVHVTTVVKIRDFSCFQSPKTVLKALESSMGLFQQQWQESHRGGELSKYGNFPEPDWTLDVLDAMRNGWLQTNREWQLRVLEDEDGTVMTYGPSLDCVEDEFFLDDDSHLKIEPGRISNELGNRASLLQQSRMILDHMWCSEDSMQVNVSQRSDWHEHKQQTRASWPQPVLRTMALLAAVVTCRIPLSAAAWVNRYFVPVYVQYGEQLMTFRLLARLARQDEGERSQERQMLSIGQHVAQGATRSLPFGKDFFHVGAKG